MLIDVSTRAVAVARAGSTPISPVYQDTVLAGVPATNAVAVAGGPLTRCGVPLKKLSAAAMAEAAASDVLASVWIEPVKAVCRLAAVVAASTPIVNSFGPGVADVVAVSLMTSLVPSGRLKWNCTVSPALGTPVKSIDIAGGAPAGPVTVEFESPVLTLASLNPNIVGGASSATCTEVAVGAEITMRPRPSVPRSASLRSATTCLKPARTPSPSIMSSKLATEGFSASRPEKM